MAARGKVSDSLSQLVAQGAVNRAVAEAKFDDIRGVIVVGSEEFGRLRELRLRLREVYISAFRNVSHRRQRISYSSIDAHITHEFRAFLDAVRPPDGTEEIASSRDLVNERDRSRILRIDLEGINDELIQHLARHPERMRSLDPRKFEELVAELFRAKGYTVELTPRSRDGGLDIIAIERSAVGAAMTLIECKRYAASKRVGVGIVRGLYGVVEARKATRGLIATTSHFTREAETFRDEVRYRMALADFDKLTQFLREWPRKR